MSKGISISNKMNRAKKLFVALLLALTGLQSIFAVTRVGAYTLPVNRYIMMSSSANGATDVTYQVGFTTNQNSATASVGGAVIDFCSNSPIIGDTCTAPTGFNINEAGLVLANQSGITDFQIESETDTNTLILSRTGGPANVNTAVAITIDLGSTGGSDGVTNPTTTNATFYARILTFATQVGAEEYESDDIDDADDDTGAAGNGPHVVHDAGGVALSTAEQITITAKVQERLTFCVFTVDGSVADTCGTGIGSTAPSGNAVTLGDTTGVLSDQGPFVDINVKYSVQTNAGGTSNSITGVAIRVKGGTLKSTPGCAETAGQNCSINAIGNTATASAAGTEQFGLCTYQSVGSGLTPSAPYNHADCNLATQTAGTATPGGASTAQFAFDNNNTDGTVSTYGDVLAVKTAGSFSTGIIALLGNIAVTTEPGIYISTLTFIATGTF